MSHSWQGYAPELPELIGQAQNLYADCQYGNMKTADTVKVMKSLRLDFAQQFPRGASFKSEGEN